MIVCVLGMKLPEKIGLEYGCSRLMFQVSLNKRSLYLYLGRAWKGVPLEDDPVGHVRRTNRIMLDGIIRHQIHRRVHMSAIVIVAFLDSSHLLHNFQGLPKLRIL
jgi:hypothetical protein